MTKSTKPQFVVRPTAYRAWNGSQMVDVQTLSWNAGGMLWHGAGGQMGWAWINPEYKGWSESNPKPGDGDIYPVMQWTGFKDGKGNDIYEGDIASFGDEKAPLCTGVIRFGRFLEPIGENSSVSSVGWFLGDYKEGYGSGIGLGSEAFNSQDKLFVVIGNLFQNPELLET